MCTDFQTNPYSNSWGLFIDEDAVTHSRARPLLRAAGVATDNSSFQFAGENNQLAVHKFGLTQKMNVIYKPAGKAREYADLAINLYKGCTHGCRYCFGAKTPWVSADDYYKTANPKKDVISKLQKDCQKLNVDSPEILLSFIGDVYQHAEVDLGSPGRLSRS